MPDEFDAMAADAVPLRDGPPWPSPMADDARHGLVGDFLALVEEHTEADSAALLVQLLVAVGNAIGHGPSWRIGRTHHHLNTYAVIVGETAAGRKGTSLDEVLHLVRRGDPTWEPRSRFTGIGSGEVLVHEVRDDRLVTNRKGEEELERGVDDKRMLVVESELAGLLGVARREGATLSAHLRAAWDSGNLRTTTKTAPATATAAHISLIGHITAGELRAKLAESEVSGGLVNRVLWCCARRSRFLPLGGEVDEAAMDALVQRFAAAIDFGRGFAGEVGMDAEARDAWCDLYPSLSTPPRGRIGDILNRGPAQVRRLALLYTLLDGETETRLVHLNAALAVWSYCEASAGHIFGASLGDADAEKILAALQVPPHELDGAGLHRLFSGNRPKELIHKAIDVLVDRGLAERVDVPIGGRGRPRKLVRIKSVDSFSSFFVPGDAGEAAA